MYVYVMDLRFKAAIRASIKYRKKLERFSRGYPSVMESEVHLDRAFADLCAELQRPGMRDLLHRVLELHEEATDELALGLNREEVKHALEIERRIARQGGIKSRTTSRVFQEAVCIPHQLRLFNDTDALIAALNEQHNRAKQLINKSRKLDRAEKIAVKKNVRHAAASSSFAIVMFTGNGLVAPGLLPLSGAAGFFALHMAIRDMLE